MLLSAFAGAAVAGAVLASSWSTGPAAPMPPPVGPTPPVVTSPVGDGGPLRYAEDNVDSMVAQDATRVAGLEGSWVPQVSSKRPGMTVGGIDYDWTAIVADHERLAVAYPDAVLLKSDDFATFTSSGYYVTVIGTPFATPSDANAWCDRQGFGADDCFAKRLSHSPGVGADVVHR